jgi:hypothetical protein
MNNKGSDFQLEKCWLSSEVEREEVSCKKKKASLFGNLLKPKLKLAVSYCTTNRNNSMIYKHLVHGTYRIYIHCCPQNSLISLGHELHKLLKAFHRDAGPCWLQCLPQLCQVGWWTILDTHGKLLSVKNPAALQFLTQNGAPGTYYHTSFKCTYILCLAHSFSEWHTHTIHVSIVSRLKNPSSTCLLPFIYTDWSGFNEWHQ